MIFVCLFVFPFFFITASTSPPPRVFRRALAVGRHCLHRHHGDVVLAFPGLVEHGSDKRELGLLAVLGPSEVVVPAFSWTVRC